ncbi:MAG: type II secretion system F family protein [Gemmatimonadaceae bacterium]
MTTAFRYRASTPSGAMQEGVVHASTPREAIDALRRQSLVPVVVEAASDRPRMPTGRQSRVDAQATTLRALATLLAAGAPLDRALGFAAEHAGHADVAARLVAVRQRVRDGHGLAASLGAEDLVSPFGCAVVRAGEDSGSLDEALARLAEHYERVRDVRAQVQSALLYPALMAAVAAIGIVVLLLFVVPRFSVLLADTGGTLPWSTALLVRVSHAVTNGWWVWVPVVLGIAVGMRQWLGNPANRARWHALRLRWPLSGDLERTMSAARFLRALGVLLRGGVGTIPALRLARDVVTNASLRSRLDAAVGEVAEGQPIGAAVSSTLPPLAAQLVAAGEESGSLDVMCLRAADALDSDVQRRLKGLIALIEPALIVLFGGVVGFIALALLQAVYSINAGTLS